MDFKLKPTKDLEGCINIKKIVNYTGDLDCATLYFRMLLCDHLATKENADSYYTDDKEMMEDFCRIFGTEADIVYKTFDALKRLDLIEVDEDGD